MHFETFEELLAEVGYIVVGVHVRKRISQGNASLHWTCHAKRNPLDDEDIVDQKSQKFRVHNC